MSQLTVMEAGTGREVLKTGDAAKAFKGIGVRFERWEDVAVPDGASERRSWPPVARTWTG